MSTLMSVKSEFKKIRLFYCFCVNVFVCKVRLSPCERIFKKSATIDAVGSVIQSALRYPSLKCCQQCKLVVFFYAWVCVKRYRDTCASFSLTSSLLNASFFCLFF